MAKNRRQKKEDFNGWKIPIIIFSLGILIAIILIFFVPFSYEKYSLSTDKATVQYNSQESYQETVNYDGCDSGSGCVCTLHGGFLWLTCKQCSCTRERTVVAEKVVDVLKETTESASASLFKTWTSSRISEEEARQTIQVLLDFTMKKGESYVGITGISKEGGNWKFLVGNTDIYLDANSGRILYINNNGQTTSFDSLLKEFNTQ